MNCDGTPIFYTTRIFTELKFLENVADIGYTCNCLRLLSQDIFEDVELPVQVGTRRCSCNFTHLDPFKQINADLINKKAVFTLNELIVFEYSSPFYIDLISMSSYIATR